MRVIFTTLGSTGDLFPLLPVAQELARRGHVVRFAANPTFRRTIEGEGLAFVPIGVELGPDEYMTHPEILSPQRGGLIGLRTLFRHFLLPHLCRMFEDLREATHGCDALLAHPAQLAAPMVAEALSIPWLTLSMFPGNIPSRHTVPQGAMHRAFTGRLGERLNLFAWEVGRWMLRREFDDPLNDIRRALGLREKRDLFLLGGLSPRAVLLLCSEHYAGRPADWPDHVVCTGFTPFDAPQGQAVPGALRRFLEAGDPPVLVSLGDSAAFAPEDFFDQARRALEGIGRRGVFLVGRHANLGSVPAALSEGLGGAPVRAFLGGAPALRGFRPCRRFRRHVSGSARRGAAGHRATRVRSTVAWRTRPRAGPRRFCALGSSESHAFKRRFNVCCEMRRSVNERARWLINWGATMARVAPPTASSRRSAIGNRR
jgi:UDP:flavonoid glycosyltransferase YjiC (YdhE family)